MSFISSQLPKPFTVMSTSLRCRRRRAVQLPQLAFTMLIVSVMLLLNILTVSVFGKATYCYVCNSDHDASCNSPLEAFRTPPTTIVEMFMNGSALEQAYSQYAVASGKKLTDPIQNKQTVPPPPPLCLDGPIPADPLQPPEPSRVLKPGCESITESCMINHEIPIKKYRSCHLPKAYVFLVNCEKLYPLGFSGECRKSVQTVKVAASNKSDDVVITTRGCGLTNLIDPVNNPSGEVKRVSKDATYSKLLYGCDTDACNSSSRAAKFYLPWFVMLVAFGMVRPKL